MPERKKERKKEKKWKDIRMKKKDWKKERVNELRKGTKK